MVRTTCGHVVLVHGAYHRGACWEPLAVELRRRGHLVDAVDLPGRGDPAAVAAATLADFVETVARPIRAAGRPVVLVGHSMGGVTVTQVAENLPDLIGSLVYLTAFIPANGQSLVDVALHEDFAGSLVIAHQRMSQDHPVSYIPVELGREAFYTDLAETAYEPFGTMLVPESTTVAIEPVAVTDDRWGRVRKVYVETLRDLALPIATQRRMHQAAGIDEVHALDTAHSPFVTDVQAVAEILTAEVDRLTAVGGSPTSHGNLDHLDANSGR
ncbi:alpha/beta hydrolase [Frankia sp. AgB1.9]|uniref:alpha/beta fold hydrolase n=1 Tax=unclassified Frankia TaxID=2632575 RepID=UPI0019319B0D|nr:MULTISPECIES: alpha/beta hydrolase [unclassified Frankia]MBL7486754.1 alpha/beta hydrolase [Frankia sp. AgW1.1]MBL7554098.1 alpha/beta hydrolase [Frankia sp. AgB1.9]MBL7618394.1 alpha/beta hydrolase [Frankia sp. AgB1.8]